MKKRVFSLFLVLALLLAALAGCGQEGGPSGSSDVNGGEEQLLGKGCYAVYDGDGELAGYLEVKGSKIIVYSERGREEDTLRYDYNAKKELYTLDDGELFGSGEFTVEKRKKALKLITEDDDEYTLEEIGKDEIEEPAPSSEAPIGPDSDSIELPLGCYAVYEGLDPRGYLKVTDSTMIHYDNDGDISVEGSYSYDRDGNCLIENGYDGKDNVRFVYAWDTYHMIFLDQDVYVHLEPIRESEIPVHEGGSGTGDPVLPEGRYYVGGNGSMDLYAWLPAELFYELEFDYTEEGSITSGMYHERGNGFALNFSAILASGDDLQDVIEEAFEAYEEYGDPNGTVSGPDDLVYGYFRYTLLSELENGYLGPEYLGGELLYDYYEDVISVDGRDWRYLEIYVALEGGGGATMTLLFWLEDGNMAAVGAGGYGLDPNSSYDVAETIFTINHSLDFYV